MRPIKYSVTTIQYEVESSINNRLKTRHIKFIFYHLSYTAGIMIEKDTDLCVAICYNAYHSGVPSIKPFQFVI